MSEVKGFLGYISGLSIWNPNLAVRLQAINDLVKKNVEFTWDAHHQKTCDYVMQALTLQSKLTSFNSNKNTILITDTSKLNGAAASLFQQEDDEKLTLI